MRYLPPIKKPSHLSIGNSAFGLRQSAFPQLPPRMGFASSCDYRKILFKFVMFKNLVWHLQGEIRIENENSSRREVSRCKLVRDRKPVSKGDVSLFNVIRNLVMSRKWNYSKGLYYIVVLLDGVYRWKVRRVWWMISIIVNYWKFYISNG